MMIGGEAVSSGPGIPQCDQLSFVSAYCLLFRGESRGLGLQRQEKRCSRVFLASSAKGFSRASAFVFSTLEADLVSRLMTGSTF